RSASTSTTAQASRTPRAASPIGSRASRTGSATWGTRRARTTPRRVSTTRRAPRRPRVDWRHSSASGSKRFRAARTGTASSSSSAAERGPLEQGCSERCEALLEVRRHRLVPGLAKEASQRYLEPVALPAVPAAVEMRLGLVALGLRQPPVEEGLDHLLALEARVVAHRSATASSA